jgi:hypothetical protein
VRELHAEDLSVSNLLAAASTAVVRDGVTAAGAVQ